MQEAGRIRFKGLPYYWGAITATKCIKAIVFVFLPGKAADKVKPDACTRWVRHMGRFYENRIYAFALASLKKLILVLRWQKRNLFSDI